MLIKELLSIGSKKLGKSLESELVLAFVLGMSREEVIAHDDVDVTADVSIKLFLKYIDELACGKPLAYILKSKEFYGADFYVDERVLVPRPETEMLVDAVLGYLNERAFVDKDYVARVNEEAVSIAESIDLGKDFRVLDIGTGSGNIVSAILRNFDNSVGVACDISRDALDVSRSNLEYHNLEDRVELVESDLLEAFDEGEEFDVIVTNPPYVAEVASDGNFVADENVAKHEPAGALFAGKDGMDVYKKLVQQLVEKKIGFNLFAGEFGAGQKEAILELLNKNFVQGFEIEIRKDLAGIPRIFVVRRG